MGNSLNQLQDRIKYCFKNSRLLEMSLTHISHSKENKLPYNYERLEFLGDSIVNFLLVDLLYEKFSRLPLGKLAMIKAYLISEQFLSRLAKKWDLPKFIKVGKNEEIKGRRESSSVHADVFEAVWAAIYIDSGRSIDFVKGLFRYHFEKDVTEAIKNGDFYTDFKTLLQEITQSLYREKPTYRLLKSEGPAHEQTFTVECRIKDFKTTAEGKTKKEAEQKAAKKMIEQHFKEIFEKKKF
ncbi:MAG TPA: ribonuclease III [Aquifex aeolicus]|uniref:Ribonuclease 3 n=1 Tax=Aquifex aeolicus TaxID=63363 RepID=A0A9D1CFJ1_AQUAO|nr:ribonuclease III [Aquifex aeolicus]